jgi:thiol-disulfide isomerase/thioredoxin
MRFSQTLVPLAALITLAGCAYAPPAIPVGDQAANKPTATVVAEPPATPVNQPVLLPTVTPDGWAAQGPTPEQQALLATLANGGPAPELTNETWFNADPLRLADLRGQVVMVEFWTFGCINCQNVIPHLQQWYAKYHDQGFEIVGVHTPEFNYEKDLTNVAAAIDRLGVTWPVAIDNEWTTWRAYGNRYWPAAYFLDKQGNIRLLQIGEGRYDYAEQVIQALLAE